MALSYQNRAMLRVESIPFLRDNYAWIVHDGTDAIIVDPGESAPILAWLELRRIQPRAILVTHHHSDHTGGILELAERFPLDVAGPDESHIPGITWPVADGMHIKFTQPDVSFSVMAIPGHTLDHMGYYGHGYLFCGDTLFSCGCGRLFEGTPAMMQHSLARLSKLPDDTLVCCAHEYTLANLAFARQLEPDNLDLQAWEHVVRQKRVQNRPSLPVSLGEEKQRNPFLRWGDSRIQQIAAENLRTSNPGAAEIFASLRKLKDVY